MLHEQTGFTAMLNFIKKHSLDDIYSLESQKHPELIKKLCAVQPADFGLDADDERALPGERYHMQSGWFRKMLGRYLAAGLCCKQAPALELCSGLGWGAYILSRYASHVTCLELDNDIRTRAEKFWKCDTIEWKTGDALCCEQIFEHKHFALISFMEAIEHFSCDNGFRMLKAIHNLLQPGGILVMSSYFPSTRADADRLCSKNDHHLYIPVPYSQLLLRLHIFIHRTQSFEKKYLSPT